MERPSRRSGSKAILIALVAVLLATTASGAAGVPSATAGAHAETEVAASPPAAPAASVPEGSGEMVRTAASPPAAVPATGAEAPAAAEHRGAVSARTDPPIAPRYRASKGRIALPQSSHGSTDLTGAQPTLPGDGEPIDIANVPLPYGCPEDAVAAPNTGLVYVTNPCAAPVDVFRGATIVAQLTLPNAEVGAYDAANGYVYLAGADGYVTVLSGTTLVANVTFASASTYVADIEFDPVNGYVYLVTLPAGPYVEGLSGNVTVLSGASVLATVALGPGAEPQMAIVDNGTGDVYVEDQGPQNVSVLSGTTLVGNFSLDVANSYAYGGAYDPENGYVYLVDTPAQYVGGNVSIVSGETIVATVPVGDNPFDAVFDPGNGLVYVPNSNDTTVSVLSGTSVVATVGLGAGNYPQLAVADPSNGLVFVTDFLSDNVSVLNGTSALEVVALPTGSGPYPLVFEPSNGWVYVLNIGNDTVSVVGPGYSVTFQESGLPSGYNWSVAYAPQGSLVGENLSGNTSPGGGTVSVPLGAGSYDYVVNGTFDYVLQGVGMPGTFTVTNRPITLLLPFRPGRTANLTFDPRFPTQFSTFYAGFFDPGSFCVRLLFSACSGYYSYNVTFFNLSAGRYPFQVQPLVDTYTGDVDLVPVHAYGNVTVGASNLTVGIALTQPLYPYTFVEQGLPPDRHWSVTVADFSVALFIELEWIATAETPRDTVTIDLPAGLGAFGVGLDFMTASASGPSPFQTSFSPYIETGNFSQSFVVTFELPVYPVPFSAPGLPPGTNWSVTVSSVGGWWTGSDTIHALTQWSDGASSLELQLPAGTYRYVTSWPGELPGTGPSRQVVVSGTTPVTTVTWYAVTFVETGLAAGADWCVRLGAAVACSETPTITFESGNASLVDRFVGVPGYVETGAPPRLRIAGEPLTLAVSFHRSGPVNLY